MVKRFFFLAACALLFPCSAFGPQGMDSDDASARMKPVDDAAHALSPKTISDINRELASFSEKHSVRLKIVTLNPDTLGNKTSFGRDACRLAAIAGLREGLANRGAIMLLIKGKGVGICVSSDLESQFENALGEKLVANFIRPAVISGDMDSAAFYCAAAMTVLLAPLTSVDGKTMRASAKPGRLFQDGPFLFYLPFSLSSATICNGTSQSNL